MQFRFLVSMDALPSVSHSWEAIVLTSSLLVPLSAPFLDQLFLEEPHRRHEVARHAPFQGKHPECEPTAVPAVLLGKPTAFYPSGRDCWNHALNAAISHLQTNQSAGQQSSNRVKPAARNATAPPQPNSTSPPATTHCAPVAQPGIYADESVWERSHVPCSDEMEDAIVAANQEHEARMAVLVKERCATADRLRELLQLGHGADTFFAGRWDMGLTRNSQLGHGADTLLAGGAWDQHVHCRRGGPDARWPVA